METLFERLGEHGTLALGALLIGMGFGFLAQRSRFCMRSAVIELARNHTRGSLSGAAVGGSLFGIGMILARGCASRLLVLLAHGNLRALLSVLIFTVTAQAAMTGALSPLRLAISE